MRICFYIIIGFILSSQTSIAQDTLKVEENNEIVIELNNSYFLQGKENKDGKLGFKLVGEKGENTINIEYNYSDERSTLVVSNPYDKRMKYEAFMYSYNNDKWIETSIIPVFPGIVGYEMWPYKIDKIKLKGFKLLDE